MKSSYPNLRKKAEEIKSLASGWFDGEGGQFDKTFVDNVVVALEKILDEKNIPYPFIYPSPEGAIIAEWSIGDWEIALSFERVVAHLESIRTSSEETIENKFENWTKHDDQLLIADYIEKTFIDVVA